MKGTTALLLFLLCSPVAKVWAENDGIFYRAEETTERSYSGCIHSNIQRPVEKPPSARVPRSQLLYSQSAASGIAFSTA